MYKDTKIDWKDWENELSKNWKIATIHGRSFLDIKLEDGYLLCTSCCSSKGKATKYTRAKDYYVRSTNQNFYNWCEFLKQPYGTLSDLHALVMDNDIIHPYDKHPSSLEEKDFEEIANRIKVTLKRHNKKGIIF
jgi:hypothetical protein